MKRQERLFKEIAKRFGYDSTAHLFENFGQWIWDYGHTELKDKSFEELMNQFINLNIRKKCNK